MPNTHFSGTHFSQIGTATSNQQFITGSDDNTQRIAGSFNTQRITAGHNNHQNTDGDGNTQEITPETIHRHAGRCLTFNWTFANTYNDEWPEVNQRTPRNPPTDPSSRRDKHPRQEKQRPVSRRDCDGSLQEVVQPIPVRATQRGIQSQEQEQAQAQAQDQDQEEAASSLLTSSHGRTGSTSETYDRALAEDESITESARHDAPTCIPSESLPAPSPSPTCVSHPAGPSGDDKEKSTSSSLNHYQSGDDRQDSNFIDSPTEGQAGELNDVDSVTTAVNEGYAAAKTGTNEHGYGEAKRQKFWRKLLFGRKSLGLQSGIRK
ncbi:hypothetical protein AAF712_009046 [Marasmius tenuissimus]|uniref:Uncharacterized protein n=1 Tax=Marasmius tenuissimus TaxID=585030 RepID=A0ABR2ZT86_9AGAR